MDGGDDRRFTISFTSDGVGKLRDAVKEKLKEFLGDYTDDTLVEYVTVLLKNGRRKEEAKNELDVFLGDDSDSFINWLWDHLGSSLHLYSQSLNTQADEVGRVKPAVEETIGNNDSRKMESESEIRSKKLSKSRHRRQWKGLVGDVEEHQILKSSVGESDALKENSQRKVNSVKSRDSIHKGAQRKRFRSETRGSNKDIPISEARGSNKEGVQQAANAAPRRLLQFAVRDALATSIPFISVTEPSLKRIRSVVSAASEDTTRDEPLEARRPVTRVSSMSTVIKAVAEAAEDVKRVSSMSTVIKAVAEAAEDVKRVGPSRNVFDRLGHATDVSDIPENLTNFVEDFPVDRYPSKMDAHSSYHNDFNEQHATAMLPRDTEMAPESGYEYDGFTDMEIRDQGYKDLSQSIKVLRENVDEPLMFPYDVANNADGRAQKSFSPMSLPDASHKDVTLRSHQYQEGKKDVKLDSNKSKVENKALPVKLNVRLTGSNEEPTVVGNGNVKSEAGIIKESHKMQSSTHGLYSAGPPTKDAYSRTIYVSNVHFAATKDGLSRHFNKFGDVLKVIILSDPGTGQPKGSVYVEFMRKEAAEYALSLDGTSFMSRILKVVKKSAAPPEASSTPGWPRAARAFPFPVSGFSMIPYPRGAPNIYRARPHKPGARSLQWKRDVQPIPNKMSYQASNTSLLAAPRGLTYVRADAKTNGSSNNA